MSVREYIGARYVPLFAEPLTWDPTRTYEPLTVVLYQGNSYTSRQAVPANIDISNTTYWAQTGNYNAQIEQYRAEVQAYDGRITQNTTAIAAETSNRETADTQLNTLIANNTTAISNEVQAREAAITSESQARQNADNALDARLDALETAKKNYFGKKFLCVTDSWGTEGSYGVTKCWMRELVQDYFGGTYVDLHAGSTGYIASSQTAGNFITRLTEWVANNPSQVNSIDFVLVSGSPNDYQNNAGAISTAVTNFINYALQNLPNAEVILVPQVGNNDIGLISIASTGGGNTNPWINAAAGAQMAYRDHFTTNKRVTVVRYTTYLLFGGASFFNEDHTHPKQSGHDKICKNVYQYLMTGHSIPLRSVFVPKAVYVDTGWTGGSANLNNNVLNEYGNGQITIIDGVATISFMCGVVSAQPSTAQFFFSLGNLVPLMSIPTGNACSGGSWFKSDRLSYYGALVGRSFDDNFPYSAASSGIALLCPFMWYGESLVAAQDKITQTMTVYTELI